MSASATTTEHTVRLLELLRTRSFLKTGITLSSGEASNWYIDGKMVAVFPEGAHLIGEVFCDALEDIDVDAIGGLETGAIPIIASVASAWYRRGGASIEGFWVRNEAKRHGTQKLIEGSLQPQSRVVIVDDVVTSGKSVLKAIKAVEQMGCTVVLVLTIVDRQQGARELLSEYRYESLFSKDDFGA